MTHDDTDLEFVREFAHSGVQLGPAVSSEERRERIRVSILREGKENLPYQDTGFTYSEIYWQRYHQCIEMRRVRREARLTPEAAALAAAIDASVETSWSRLMAGPEKR
jgi:hypothetical protein